MSAQPFLPITDESWIDVKDGDPTVRSLFHRHYSYKPYRDGRDPKLFVGPGEKLVLLTPDARALFVWRKFISGDRVYMVDPEAMLYGEKPPKRKATKRKATKRKATKRKATKRKATKKRHGK